jgi:hypothetical protein
MAVNQKYLSFVEICKRNGVYIDKQCGLRFKVKGDVIYSMGRDDKWELRFAPVSMPCKKRFLKYSEKQARQL